ncbi:hypothetical protein EYF80_036770 [Liparis tanakae]|uniref:Uncharacterized protein n=1 Tax=Liparis tanakae TaxID=230148 RepID=A0A4Z2GI20_9TELE|nr:hypothetical protein EYF80_036770 [Liparis tanakae]
MDHQVEVELLNQQQLKLQDLFQNHFLACRSLLQKVAHELGAGNVELVHFTGQVRHMEVRSPQHPNERRLPSSLWAGREAGLKETPIRKQCI